MPSILEVDSQPNDFTCGPTCLHAVLRYFGNSLKLNEVIQGVSMLDKSGGSLSSQLGNFALQMGYQATIHSMNIQIFDPTWFKGGQATNLHEKLAMQMQKKSENPKLVEASKAYLDFLELGGKIRFSELLAANLLGYLTDKQPIIVGLSATFLYQTAREHPETCDYDDISGEPSGHFVVVTADEEDVGQVNISDPFHDNPFGKSSYKQSVEHLICSILLGVLTYDANILILKPKDHSKE